MLDLSQQKDEATAISDNIEVFLDWSFYDKPQGGATAPSLPKHLLLPLFREQKILKIRQQLAEGTYDFDGRFDIALDRFLEDLIG